jgi:hypothetical protein
MNFSNRSVLTGLLALSVCSSVVLAQENPGIHTIDAPGAGNGPGQGTIAFEVSPAGAVMGEYIDANYVYHGFLRSPQGAFITFEVPGSGAGPGYGTQPNSMNSRGEITGDFIDSNASSHGFVRYPDGEIVTFDAPGAGSGNCVPPIICANGTTGLSINPEGTVSGQYVDKDGVFHGFLRSSSGLIQRFDAPGAGTSSGQGTFVTSTDGINPAGAIAGGYADAGGVVHALIRNPDGSFATFDPPGSVFTDNSGITPNGTVTSFYADAGLAYHGYVRASDGEFTLFDVSGGGTGSGQGTEPLNINARMDVTGAYIDSNGVNHGFLRYARGTITRFDAPEAGTASGQGTIPIFNNLADAICGYYVDANGVSHGFLRTPPRDGEEE